MVDLPQSLLRGAVGGRGDEPRRAAQPAIAILAEVGMVPDAGAHPRLGQFQDAIPETGRGDEIGALARAIDRLGVSIRMAMDRLRKKA